MLGLASPVLWPVLLGVLGAIVGSFIAALVTRWPQGRSVMGGRSECDTCKTTLRAVDLVPLLSFVMLGGRCRYCPARINSLHWWIELAAVAVGAIAGRVAPGIEGIVGAVFGWLLLALGALDLVYQMLPNVLTGTLAIAGAIGGIAGLAPDPASRLIGGLAGYGALRAIALAYFAIRRREGMGGGDPKLLGAIGLWLGWQILPAVVLIACLVGLSVALIARSRGRQVAWTTAMSMGTLLAIAAYPAWVAMIEWSP